MLTICSHTNWRGGRVQEVAGVAWRLAFQMRLGPQICFPCSNIGGKNQWSQFRTVSAGIYRTGSEPVQKHPWFVPLKIPVLTGLYRTYRRISDISAEKWIPGGTKNLKKMKKVSSRKLTMPSSLVVFPCCRPFPQPSSFCFIQPLHFFLLLLLLLLLLFLLLLQFWPILFFLCLLF